MLNPQQSSIHQHYTSSNPYPNPVTYPLQYIYPNTKPPHPSPTTTTFLIKLVSTLSLGNHKSNCPSIPWFARITVGAIPCGCPRLNLKQFHHINLFPLTLQFPQNQQIPLFNPRLIQTTHPLF